LREKAKIMQEKEVYKRRLEISELQLKHANELYEEKEATKRLEFAIVTKELELLRQKQAVTPFGVFSKTQVNSLESARRLRATISMRHLIGDHLALNNSDL
jgi:hypothetical protein